MQFNSSKIKPVYWVISGLVLTIIAYFPIFNTAFVNWDDDIYIVLNNLIRSFSLENIKSWFSNSFLGLYQPLTLLSLSIDYSINGLDPRVFHSTNLLLHLCNTLLVYFFSKQLFGNTTIALMVMFLFGLHPLHVESVVWATERKDVLYSFFYLSALNLYLKYDTRKNNGSYLMVFVVFLLALLSKATAVTFPIALVLIDYVKNDKILSWKTFKNKVPFFTAALLFGIFTLYIHRSFGSLTNASEYSIFERGFFAIKGLWFFLSRTIWPIELTVYHPLPESISSWGIIESCIYFLLFTLAVIMLIRTSSKALKFGAAFFVLTLVLFLVPPGVPVLASERYYYLPSIGIFIMISALIAPYLNKTRLLKILSLSFFVLFLIILVFRTHQQAGVWQNSLSLWDHAIKVHGESHLSLLHRGKAYKQLKQYDPSLADLNRSIELNSGYYESWEHRGHLYLIREEYQPALKDLHKSLSLKNNNSFVMCSLGFAYRRTNQPDSALYYLNKALTIDEHCADAYFNRGKVFLSQNKEIQACTDLRKALSLGLAEANEDEARQLVRNLENKGYCFE